MSELGTGKDVRPGTVREHFLDCVLGENRVDWECDDVIVVVVEKVSLST